ncbi:FAD-dependent oxidoreductase [Paraburkholderia ferrariae]|uniref:FAD-dependent oxidoreductase n=1 Tax=Paraburkholderia ferrariae TaxID=386056 RepID=UPI0012EC655F|nr:FAD-dependent oxidoreductase [Paraburkholderia ferrariae]
MAAQQIDFLLIGGGLASAKAAETLRREGAEGGILIVSSEPDLPYHRPSLSKRYLLGQAGPSQILVHPEQFYSDQGIGFAVDTRIVSVDPVARCAETETGDRLHFEQLLLAPGAKPRRLAVDGADLAGIHTLRSRADCDAIRKGMATARSAVIVGGSFLGMEVAMSLREAGLAVSVVEGDGSLLRHLESAALSDFFREYAQSGGVAIHLSDPVVGFSGNREVEAVELASGASLPCDLVVTCVGVEPATEFLAGSGIALEAGRIVVDELLRTSAAGIFAAGDAVSFYDPVFLRRRHIEHWDNAIRQGRLAALNMLGRRRRYDEVSYFFCEVGGIGFNVLGDTVGVDEHIARGSLEAHSYTQFYLRDDVPRAVFSFGRPPTEIRQAEGLIRYRVNVSVEKAVLSDSGSGLDELATQNVLILQGGGALGAFECGVVKALDEHGIVPDVVAGISIGALNGAIIAGNPDNAVGALEAFWSELQICSPGMLPEHLQRAMSAMQVLQFGVPRFFRPRWIPSLDEPWTMPWEWTGFYDTSPMKQLLSGYVDFSKLKSSPIRLIVGAVNVLTAELEVFDSYVDDLTPEHILASGSLPPGFSWTFVDGKPYWDGGVVSNSPLDLVIDRCGPDGKQVYIVDLFSGERALPTNMMEIMARRDEIVYSERVRSDLRTREMKDAYRSLVASILSEVDPAVQDKIRQRPRYIQLMGDGAPMRVTRFVRKGPEGEPSSRDYDFSDVAIESNLRDGYRLAMDVLSEQESHWQSHTGRRLLSDHDFNEKPEAVMRSVREKADLDPARTEMFCDGEEQ